MIRSLYSGVSGMKNHQIRMDVVGNNISNVNTIGFKAGRTNFQDTLYQTIKSGGISTNPAQAGLGINVASISSFMNSGPLQSTTRTLDLAINGTGFFKVNRGANESYFTREGIFYVTQDGKMVNSNGYQLVGTTWQKAKQSITIADPGNPGANGDLTIRGMLADGTDGQDVTVSFTATDSLDDIIAKINAEQSTSGIMAYKRPNPTTANPNQHDLFVTTVYNGYDEDYAAGGGNQAITITTNTTGLALTGTTQMADYTENAPIQILNVPVSSMNIEKNGMITGFDDKGAPLLLYK
ncbi:MAG: flagellar hook-basal body complex protein, partial [Firmicutes bacterium]|nr:flagellar hook-basal body complex protein [Bacillota bacterium]